MTLADRTVNPEHGFIARPEGDPDDFADLYPDLDDWLHTISRWGVDLDSYCKNLRSEAQKVRNDPALNNYGKQLRLEQLRKEQEESEFIQEAHKAAEKMQDKEKELSHKLQEAVDNSEIAGPTDPVEKHIDALKLFEMRQVLLQMGQSKRMEQYIKAAENNDTLLLRAIETAHPIMSMVPPEVIQ
jgi:vacuolar-type H+-ATPase subunit I/STV1